MCSMMVGAGRLTGGPLLTSLGVTRRRLRRAPMDSPEPAGRPPAAPRPAAVRFDFGWLDGHGVPRLHSMTVRPLAAPDVDGLAAAFAAAAWPGRPAGVFRRHLSGQDAGERLVLVAQRDEELAGYLRINWRSDYPPFRAADIPEIVDLEVLPAHRRRGVATALLEVAEATIATTSTVAGISFGLHADDGPAQRLCVRRGFVPDGRGVVYAGRPVPAGAMMRLDESAALMLTKRVR